MTPSTGVAALVPAGDALAGADVAPYTFAAKEGVAFLQGVPVATARAVLLAEDARLLAGQALAVAAAEVALVRAPRDPYDPRLVRGDDLLGSVHAALLRLAGDDAEPRMLQAPVSFRATGPAVSHLLRSVGHLDAAVRRSLTGVSTSPALVDGRFLGTAGFDGFDLAASTDAVRLAVLHLAETGDRPAAPDARHPGDRAGGAALRRPRAADRTGRGAQARHRAGARGPAYVRARLARGDGDVAGAGGRAELRTGECAGPARGAATCSET